MIDEVKQKLEHIKKCALLWHQSGIGRVVAITRTCDTILEIIEREGAPPGGKRPAYDWTQIGDTLVCTNRVEAAAAIRNVTPEEDAILRAAARDAAVLVAKGKLQKGE